MNEKVKDSGSTQEFSTGAHRDNPKGKGDCSLLPLTEVAATMNDLVLQNIANFMETNNIEYLKSALRASTTTLKEYSYDGVVECLKNDGVNIDSADKEKACLAHMMIEVSKLYQAGAEKYGRNNWKLGMPVERYIDSGVRHYLKTLRGDTDEPHYRGFVWNLLCAMWTVNNQSKQTKNDDKPLSGDADSSESEKDVIHCKDCKHYNCETRRCKHPNLDFDVECYDHWLEMEPSDTCSYGDKKENNK